MTRFFRRERDALVEYEQFDLYDHLALARRGARNQPDREPDSYDDLYAHRHESVWANDGKCDG
jgi:hypothetical protein